VIWKKGNARHTHDRCADTHHNAIWSVAMFQTGRKQIAEGTYHLSCCHAHRLDREFAPAHVEQVFQAGSKQVDDEDVVQSLLTKVVYLGYTRCPDPRRKQGRSRKRKARKQKSTF
jgi:hypothetical protein